MSLMFQFVSKRPLTTLLLAATVCLEVVAWSLERGPIRELSFSILFLAPSGLLAVWLALGQTRWWRRLIMVGACLVLTAAIVGADDGMILINLVLLGLYAGIVAAITHAARTLGLLTCSAAEGESPGARRWQFSIKHLLIWMTVVAVVSAIARISNLGQVEFGVLAVVLATFVFVPVAAVLLLKGQQTGWHRLAVLLVAAVLIGLIAEYGLINAMTGDQFANGELTAVLLVQTFFTGIWIMVVDSDIRREQRLAQQSQDEQ